MRVLYVTPFYPPDLGGISTHVRKIAVLSQNSGNRTKIISPRHLFSKDEELQSGVIKIRSVYLPPWPFPTLKSISLPQDLGLGIHRIIKQFQPDVVHVHGHHYPLSWLALLISRRHKIPTVLTMHGMYALDPTRKEGRTALEEIFNRLLFTLLLHHTSAVIGLTERITDYAKKYATGRNTLFFTIPNGIDTLPFDTNRSKKYMFRRKYNIQQDSTVILFRGRFEEVKSIIEFSLAIKKLLNSNPSKIEVVIVGGGSLKNKVISILQLNNRVRVMDWQPIDLVHEIYLMSDIFVIPSKFEALPITLVEAMNAHLHIAYTAVGGMHEILSSYSKKTEISEPTVEGIYTTLASIISNSRSVEIEQKSVAYASSLDWANIYPRVNELYNCLRKRE